MTAEEASRQPDQPATVEAVSRQPVSGAPSPGSGQAVRGATPVQVRQMMGAAPAFVDQAVLAPPPARAGEAGQYGAVLHGTHPQEASPSSTARYGVGSHGLTAAEAAPQGAAPQGVAPEAAPQEAAPQVAAAPEVAPYVPAAAEAAPHNAAPHDAAPHDAAPHDAAPHDAAPHEAAPHDAAPPEAAPREAAPDDAGSPGTGPDPGTSQQSVPQQVARQQDVAEHQPVSPRPDVPTARGSAPVPTMTSRNDEQQPAARRSRQEDGSDADTVLTAVRELPGVRGAELVGEPGQQQVLRLDLVATVDPHTVGLQAADLLRDRLGVHAAVRARTQPDRDSGAGGRRRADRTPADDRPRPAVKVEQV
ncbi:MAG: hypothetical protein ACRDT6_17995, partial [Micromonosporaceae bacterium]